MTLLVIPPLVTVTVTVLLSKPVLASAFIINEQLPVRFVGKIFVTVSQFALLANTSNAVSDGGALVKLLLFLHTISCIISHIVILSFLLLFFYTVFRMVFYKFLYF